MWTNLARIAPISIASITLVASIAFAAPAPASPQCTDTGPNTTICQTPGHSQITTSPNPALTNPFPWMYGGFGIGLGGVWIGW
jgi:hypothetical protein